MHSETLGKLSEALAKAQAEMGSAKLTKVNPHLKTRYADLASIIDTIKMPLAKHSLAVVQYCEDTDDATYLVTKLMHVSGEFIQGRMRLVIDKNTMQGLGSAITYARRYSLAAIVNVASDEDDDGHNASVGMASGNPSVNTATKPKPLTGGPTEPQLKRLFAKSKQAGLVGDQVKGLMREMYGIEVSAELNRTQYDEICALLDKMAVEREEAERAGLGF